MIKENILFYFKTLSKEKHKTSENNNKKNDY
jgi:hypothetical protein